MVESGGDQEGSSLGGLDFRRRKHTQTLTGDSTMQHAGGREKAREQIAYLGSYCQQRVGKRYYTEGGGLCELQAGGC